MCVYIFVLNLYSFLPYNRAFGACAYSQTNTLWELIENAGVPILYILWLTSVGLYSSRGTCSLIGASATKRDNTVCIAQAVCNHCICATDVLCEYVLYIQCELNWKKLCRYLYINHFVLKNSCIVWEFWHLCDTDKSNINFGLCIFIF